jgi:hypothetical protein
LSAPSYNVLAAYKKNQGPACVPSIWPCLSVPAWECQLGGWEACGTSAGPASSSSSSSIYAPTPRTCCHCQEPCGLVGQREWCQHWVCPMTCHPPSLGSMAAVTPPLLKAPAVQLPSICSLCLLPLCLAPLPAYLPCLGTWCQLLPMLSLSPWPSGVMEVLTPRSHSPAPGIHALGPSVRGRHPSLIGKMELFARF